MGFITAYDISDEQGFFDIELPSQGLLVFSHLSYLDDSLLIADLDVGRDTLFMLIAKNNLLSEVIIREDTQEKTDEKVYRFENEGYYTGFEESIEALLSKIQGVDIDSDGIIYFRGKRIKRVLLDGVDIFDTQYTTATRSLRPEYIEAYEFIDEYVKEEMLKGFVSSQDMVLNVSLKDEFRTAWFGDAELGLGNRERFLAQGNNYIIDRYVKSVTFLQKENVGYGIKGGLFEQDNTEFNELAYNRDVAGSLLSATSSNLRGIAREDYYNDDNGLLSSNMVLKKDKCNTKISFKWDELSTSNATVIETKFNDQNSGYRSSENNEYQRRRLRVYSSNSYQISETTKLNTNIEWMRGNATSSDLTNIMLDQESTMSSLESPSDNNNLKLNIQYLNRFSENILSEFNASYIKSTFTESSLQSGNLTTGILSNQLLGKQVYIEEIADTDIHIKVYWKSKKWKSGIQLGYLKRRDLISNQLIFDTNMTEFQSGMRRIDAPYLGGWLDWKSKKWSLKWTSDYHYNIDTFDPTQREILDNNSITMSYKASRKWRVFGSLRSFKSASSALSSFNISHFTNILNRVTSNRPYGSQRSNALFILNNYLDPAHLFEFNASFSFGLRQIPRTQIEVNGVSEVSETLALEYVPTYSFNIECDKYLKVIKSNLGVGIRGSFNESNFSFLTFDEYHLVERGLYASLSSKVLDNIAFRIKSQLLSVSHIGLTNGRKNRDLEIQYIENDLGLDLYLLATKMKISLDLRSYTGGREKGILDQSIMDANVSFKFNEDLDLALILNNILGVSYYTVDELGLVSTTDYTARLQPRYFLFSIKKRL